MSQSLAAATPPASADAGSTRLAYTLLFLAPAFWSVNYLVARWAPGLIAPHALALCRWTPAALLLACFCWRELRDKRHRVRAEAGQLLVLGALGMWVCGAFVYIGGRSTSAVNLGLVYAAAPVVIALISALWLRERLHWLQGLGVVLSLAGLVHILIRGEWSALGDVRINPGDGWVAVAVVAWAGYSLLLKAWPSAFGGIARLTLTAAAGVLVLLPFALWEALFWLPSTLSWRSAGLVLAVAVLPGAAAYGAYSYMQRVLGAARAGMVLYIGPLYNALIAWVVLGERIEWFHAVGALLILPGIWLATRVGRVPVSN